MVDKDKRTNAYTVRYNGDEDVLVRSAAGANSLEVATWIRMVSVAAAKADPKMLQIQERLQAQIHDLTIAIELLDASVREGKSAPTIYQRGGRDIDEQNAKKKKRR